jgi:hypothetical protein
MTITPGLVAQFVDISRLWARYKIQFEPKPLKWLCAESTIYENVDVSLLPKLLAVWCKNYLSSTWVLDEEWLLPSLLLCHIGWTIE